MPTTAVAAIDEIERVRLRLALASAQLGVFEIDVANARLIWANERIFAIHGWPLGSPPSMADVWERIVPPEDSDWVRQAYERSVKPRSSLALRHRIRRASDGAIRHIEVRAAWHGRGRDTRLIGITRDVTDEETMAQDLRAAYGQAQQQASILQSLMDHVPEGIAVAFGEDAVIHTVSRHGMRMTERAPDRLVGIGADRLSQAWQVFHLDGVTLATADELPLPRACRGEVVDGEEWMLRASTGRLIPVLCNAGPIRNGEGRVIGGVIAWRDISALKRIEAERAGLLVREQQLRAEAQEANRTKDAFLARLSHELRTPLSAVLGWARVIRSRAADSPELVQAARIIEHNATLQAALVDDLLDTSRILAGRFSLNSERIELSAVLLHAIDSVMPLAQSRHVGIESDLAPGLWIDGDAIRLQQVACNLLSNAVKFSPPEACVRVTARADADRVTVTISDPGVGVAAEHLEAIFQPFWQVDDTSGLSSGGLGLGLSIVKSIVASHGGTVWAESGGRGQGTRFVVTLPGAEAPPQR